MRFTSVTIKNYRALAHVELTDLSNLVVIAGPNGSGKTCIFDAIRLLKSCYAGYRQNELNQWFTEQRVNDGRGDYRDLAKNPEQPVRISAEVELTASEWKHIRKIAPAQLRDIVADLVEPPREVGNEPIRLNALDDWKRQREEARLFDELWPQLEEELVNTSLRAEVEIHPKTQTISILKESKVLQLVWGRYDPEQIGILDFHGAHRTFSHEPVASINVASNDRYQYARTHSLYGTHAKYTGIKSQMASAYVRELVRKDAGEQTTEESSTVEGILKDLFAKFFPHKEFLGVVPGRDGTLSFPIRTSDGRIHDLDALSSGEKEILFGYLRLLNLAPQNSVILLDEPELHLNPALAGEIPEFYRKHLSEPLNNQVWLITHSDACLREAITIPRTSVWHLSQGEGNQQATKIAREGDIERAVIDLVGNLSSYRPGARVLFLEGENSEFDKFVVTTLFASEMANINVISVGSKTRLQAVNEILQRATSEVGWSARFYAIRDRDLDRGASSFPPSTYLWDAYHIENYLLEPRFIKEVLDESQKDTELKTEEDVEHALIEIAESEISGFLWASLRDHAREALRLASNLKVKPQGDPIAVLRKSIASAVEEVARVAASELDEVTLRNREQEVRVRLAAQVKSGEWRVEFPGKRVLALFKQKYVTGIDADVFTRLLVNKMARNAHKPPGMAKVLANISGAGL